MKTLGIYYATACYRDEQGRYYTSGGLGRYLQSMMRYPIEVVLAAPVTTEPLKHLSYPLPEERLTVYELPYFETFQQAVRVRGTLLRRIRQLPQHHRIDVMWLRYPGAYGTAVWLLMRKHGIPLFMEIVGDPSEVIRFSSQIKPLQRLLGLLVARYHEATVRRMLRDVPGFAVSPPLSTRFSPFEKKIPVIACSTTTDGDFYRRQDTCTDTTVKVLFVGGLNHQKSVDTLIRAAGIVQQRGLPVQLHLVGDGPLRDYLYRLAQTTLQPDTYYFHGFVVDSAKLHQHYLSADIFVLSSIHEGFPRVLPEAMARSLPVIATDVGGIPEIVHHEETGLLVPPQDPEELACAIQRVVGDSGLRRRLISNSFSLARQYTVETFLNKVFHFVKDTTGVDLLGECVFSSSNPAL